MWINDGGQGRWRGEGMENEVGVLRNYVGWVDQMRCMAIYFLNLFLKISEWWGQVEGVGGGGYGEWAGSPPLPAE